MPPSAGLLFAPRGCRSAGPRALRVALSLLLTAAIASPPATANGQPVDRAEVRDKKPSAAVKAEARRRFMRANQHYRDGNYKEALLIYQAALDLYEEPGILYNMAQTYEKLREPGLAALFFERYLVARPDAPDRKSVLERLDSLRGQARVPVQITSYPPGAAIFVGGRAAGVAGRTPATLRLPLGNQQILMELSGFVPEERTLDVQLGDRNLVDVQLRRRSSIRVDADVPGATVKMLVQRGDEGHRLPHVFEVDPGKYPIHVGLKGYYPVTRDVEVEAGEQISLLVNLKPLPRYGMLQVEGVRGATVILEGRTFGHLPMPPKKVAAGTYGVKVSREGYRTWEARVMVNPDRLTVARVDLTPFRSGTINGVVYGSAALAAASLVTSAVVGALAMRTERDFNSGEPTREKHDQGTTQALVSDIFLATGVAAGLVAAITYFATIRGDSTADISFSDSAPVEPSP